MKEATGELNLTVITVVAIGLMATFFFTIFWPMVRGGFKKDTACNIADCPYGENGTNVSNGFYINCTYKDKDGTEKNLTNQCPYKG